MNETPTPRTDAAIRDKFFPLGYEEFARQLERELSEAKKTIAGYLPLTDAACQLPDQLLDVHAICDQRDKARQQLFASQLACERKDKALREALFEIETSHVDWARLNSQSPDYDPNYKPDRPEPIGTIEAALSTTPPTDTLQKVKEALEAGKRLAEDAYVDWRNAGGPNECEHGHAAGVPCKNCDREKCKHALNLLEGKEGK